MGGGGRKGDGGIGVGAEENDVIFFFTKNTCCCSGVADSGRSSRSNPW